jgi:short-subunit dehydrogenase
LTATRTALITGSSGGIGAELARVCAREGHDLVLVARGRGLLEKLAAELSAQHGISARVEPADLAMPGAARELFERLAAAGVSVDILINNAGFGSVGPFFDTDPAVSAEMVGLNVGAVVDLTRLVLPGMVERRRAHASRPSGSTTRSCGCPAPSRRAASPPGSPASSTRAKP